MAYKKNKLEYFKWLQDQVAHRGHQTRGLEYSELLKHTHSISKDRYARLMLHLYSTDFKWSVPHDDNRLEEGLALRERYCRNVKCKWENAEFAPNCSLLEVIFALSIRCYEQSVGMTKIQVSVSSWFWQLINNCGLLDAIDSGYNALNVTLIINRLMYREYDSDGCNGGLFPLKRRCKDQRKVELWYQMAAYLHENFFYD